MNFTRLVFTLCNLGILAIAASAKPVTWNLTNVTFMDGGTASGSFVYDASTQTYSAINITTTNGSRRTGVTYHFAQSTPGLGQYDAKFLTSATNQAGLPGLLLIYPQPGLSDAGGTVQLATGMSLEMTCNSSTCDSFTSPQRFVTGGSVEAETTLGGCSANSGHANSNANCTPTPSSYCQATGGKVVHRQATYNTNADNHSLWLTMANIHDFCEYTSPKDGSMASIFLDTLMAEKPTLAALAYEARIPSTVPPGPLNPGAQYCAQLGGTSNFGGPADVSGSGWVNMASKYQVLSVCVFPDTSAIDAFALFYHATGSDSGIDLTTVLRYKGPTGKKSILSGSNE